MGFADPVGVVELAPGTSVGLDDGTSVITDPTTDAAILVNDSGAYPTGPRGFPAAAGTTFATGDFDNLQVALFRQTGAGGYALLIEWYLDAAGAFVVGTSRAMISGAALYYDSIPIQAPFCRFTVTPSAPGAGESATLRVVMRKGAGGATAAGDGLLMARSWLALAPGPSSTEQGVAVAPGPATWSVYTGAADWWAWVYAVDYNGAATIIAMMDGGSVGNGGTDTVILPARVPALGVYNWGGAAADFFVSLTAPTRRA